MFYENFKILTCCILFLQNIENILNVNKNKNLSMYTSQFVPIFLSNNEIHQFFHVNIS